MDIVRLSSAEVTMRPYTTHKRYICLSEEEISRIGSYRNPTDVRVNNRIDIILDLHANMSIKGVAEKNYSGAITVRNLLALYKQIGVECVLKQYHGRQGRKLTPAVIDKIEELMFSRTPEGVCKWSNKSITAEIVRLGLVSSLNQNTVWRQTKDKINFRTGEILNKEVV